MALGIPTLTTVPSFPGGTVGCTDATGAVTQSRGRGDPVESSAKATVRVRGVLLTPSGGILLIKRTRVGEEPYWVFPGGGVEEQDESFEAALVREVVEETGTIPPPVVHKLVYVLARRGGSEKEMYFLASITQWSRGNATGDEFTRESSGRYEYDEVPSFPSEWEKRNVKPAVVKAFILENLHNLDGLPDLR